MRNLKKFLALVLAMMMAFSLLATANAQNPNYDYPDIEDATFTEAIDVLTGMGVFRGDNGNFKPSANIMRSEAVAVLYRLVTGDVTDSQAQLYAPAAAYFTDVAPTAWYAGYVGFAVDAGFIKGFNGEFNPNGYVTGYEMLAMLLRAVGYGKNGEFTGSQWMINVGATAQSLGILKTIESTDFANTLAKASPREVVAELTFQTASAVPTVRYEYGYYNQYQGVAVATGGNKLNPTLGAKVFGLTSESGIVLGNQETGESETIVGTAGDYDYTNTDYQISVDTKTTLALYGHAVTVWYRNNSAATKQGYAIIDEATSAIVYAKDNSMAPPSSSPVTPAGKLYSAVAALDDFNVARSLAADAIHWSAEYGRFSTNATISAESPIKMYAVIDNTGNGGVDAIIRLNAEVAQITQTNTTKVPQTLTLGGKKASSFGTAGVLTASGGGNQILPNSTKTLGEIVTAWQVAGTKTAASDSTNPATAFYRLSSPLKTVTGTVATYTVDGTKVDSVKLATGETLKWSGILEAEKDIAYYADKGVNTADIKAGVNYTFVVDDLGRFLDVSSPNEWSFMYATYADFQYGQLGSGDINYWMYGIDWEGKNVNEKSLTSMIVNGNTYPAGTTTLGDGYVSTNLKVTKKDMATNSVQPGINIGVMMNNKGQMVEVGTNGITDGSIKMAETQWKITKQNAANGFALVNSDDNYMLTNDTLFYVVTGFGTGATVKTYKGISELVGSGTSATITYANEMDEVWFKVGSYAFDNINTSDNKTITTVILSAENLEDYSAQNLYFSAPGNTKTDVQLAGTEVGDHINQYELWLNGEANTYWIADNGTNNIAIGDTNGTFYTLSKFTEINGVTVYKVTKIIDTGDPKEADYTEGGVCEVNKFYNYIMVNQYNKAEIGGLIMNVDGAVVADVEYTGAEGRIEIDSLQKLNNAVSIYGTNKITVAIVNDGINVATIYVVGVNMT